MDRKKLIVVAVAILVVAPWASPSVAMDEREIIYRLGASRSSEHQQALDELKHVLSTSDGQARLVAALDELLSVNDSECSERAAFVVQLAYKHSTPQLEQLVPKLVRVASRRDSRTSCEALQALGSIGGGAMSALPMLRRTIAFKGSNRALYVVRAAKAIAQIEPGDESLEPLLDCLRDKGDDVRWMAAQSLGALKTRAAPAEPDLRRALTDKHPSVRAFAAGALWRVANDTKSTVPVLAAALAEPDAPAYFRLLHISEWTPSHRFYVAVYLKEMGRAASPAVPALVAAIDDDDLALRVFIIKALGSIPDRGQAADDALRRAAQDNNSDVRAAAIEALGESHDE